MDGKFMLYDLKPGDNKVKRIAATSGKLADIGETCDERDWRLISANWEALNGAELVFEQWESSKRRDPLPIASGAHDHCEFCATHFTTIPGDMHEGYVNKKPLCEQLYYWICADCFKDFQHMFNWRVVADN